MEAIVILLILLIVLVLLYGNGALKLLKRIEDRQIVQSTHMTTVLRAVSSTQSDVRQRLRSDGVEPILDKPKAAQHYEGRGVKRVARGGKADATGGESPTARIGQVKRGRYGGTSGEPGGS